jgi:hypothetical protein
MTYKLTVYFKGLFGGKKEYNLVAHYCPQDMPGFVVLVDLDHSFELINLQTIKHIAVSKDMFYLQQKKALENK